MQNKAANKNSSSRFPAAALPLPLASFQSPSRALASFQSPSRALAFVPGLVRVGVGIGANACLPTQGLRPPANAPVLPARRGLAFNDNCFVPALSSATRAAPLVGSPLSNAGLGVGLAVSNRYRHSNLARQKISAANKGNIPWNKGRKHSEETKQKISMATRAAMGTPEIRAKLRFHATGRKHSEETKRKIRTSTRKKRTGNGGLFGKSSQRRNPVPFVFNPEMHSILDSRIQKRYFQETLDATKTASGRPKRPMPESTRKKLSDRIRALWEDGDYRDRVRNGIESRKKIGGRSTLSETHRANISKTLKEKHAARRKEMGLPPSPKSRARRPRKVTPGNDPAVGTRFSEAYLTPEAKLARDERRELTRKLLDDAEELEKESSSRRVREMDQKKLAAEKKELAKSKKEAREALNNDRILMESLALAGQLPSLEEECAMVGSTFQFGSATQTELPFMQTAGFDSTDALFLDPVESLPDPLVGDPLSPTTDNNNNDTAPAGNNNNMTLERYSGTSSAFGGNLFTANPFPNMAEKSMETGGGVASRRTKKNKKKKKNGDDVLTMPFIGNEAVFPDEIVAAEDDDDDIDDDDEEVLYDEEGIPAGTNSFSTGISVQDSNSNSNINAVLKSSSSPLPEHEEVALGSKASDLESIIFGTPSRRVYRYVNGERVLQTANNS